MINNKSGDQRFTLFDEWIGKSEGAVARTWCNACMLVVDIGHGCPLNPFSDRVEVSGLIEMQHDTTDWVGDALLGLDVRIGLSITKREIANASHSSITCNEGLKKYLIMLGVRLHENASDSRYGTQFEKWYSGDFREKFLIYTFGEKVTTGINDHIRSLMKV